MTKPDSFRLPPFAALRAFYAVASAGRLKAAATLLGISESAVSHQIKKLEEYFGQPLFDRVGSALRLNRQGDRYFRQIDPAMRSLSEATQALLGSDRSNSRVGLSLSPSLAMLWLIPRIGEFEAACPDIRLDLITTSALVDLRRDQVDLAIRYGRGSWPGVVAEPLMDEQAAPVCAASWKSDPRLNDPADALASIRLVTSTYYADEWSEWAAAHGLPSPERNKMLVLDSYEQSLEAAAQGLGLAMGRSPLVDKRLADGAVALAFGPLEASSARYYLCQAEGINPTARARRVARWLQDTVRNKPVKTELHP